MNPLAPEVSKEWHSSVTLELRVHIMNKLHMSVMRHTLPEHKQNHVINYVQASEKKMFQAADSRSEYYHLVAEKIYKIQRALEDRRHAIEELGLVANPMQASYHTPGVPEISKEWHKTFTNIQRSEVIQKIIQSLMAYHNQNAVVDFVRKAERMCFERASSQHEYLYFVAGVVQREMGLRRDEVNLDSMASSSHEDETYMELSEILDDHTTDAAMQQLQADFQANSLDEK